MVMLVLTESNRCLCYICLDDEVNLSSGASILTACSAIYHILYESIPIVVSKLFETYHDVIISLAIERQI